MSGQIRDCDRTFLEWLTGYCVNSSLEGIDSLLGGIGISFRSGDALTSSDRGMLAKLFLVYLSAALYDGATQIRIRLEKGRAYVHLLRIDGTESGCDHPPTPAASALIDELNMTAQYFARQSVKVPIRLSWHDQPFTLAIVTAPNGQSVSCNIEFVH